MLFRTISMILQYLWTSFLRVVFYFDYDDVDDSSRNYQHDNTTTTIGWLLIGLTVLVATMISIVGSTIYHSKRRNQLTVELQEAQAKLRYLQDTLSHDTENEKTTTITKTSSRMRSNSTTTVDKDTKEIRIFMDGAFDLLHFGHMNAFRLARSLGTHLIVGINSDESITECKGPPLMNNEQRLAMVESCKFVDEVVPNCPYIMNANYLKWVIQTYRIDYVVHGDDPCFVDGIDVYASAKASGKFRTIPRTAGVSTTDIVGRMLLLTKEHHYFSSPSHDEDDDVDANEGRCLNNNTEEIDDADEIDEEDNSIIAVQNSSSKALLPVTVAPTTMIHRRRGASYNKNTSSSPKQNQSSSSRDSTNSSTSSSILGGAGAHSSSRFLTTSRMLQLFSSDIKGPKKDMKIIYIDGSWDLFHPGHVSILKKAKERGDYLLVGVHGDAIVNKIQGMNLPLMNLHERVLSVLGCRYVNDVIIDAPFEITPEMISSFNISEVVRGVCSSLPNANDGDSYNRSILNNNPLEQQKYYEDIRYRHAKQLGIYATIPFPTSFRITSVIQRIQKNQEVFQAKFERKMEAELQYTSSYYNSRIHEQNNNDDGKVSKSQ